MYKNSDYVICLICENEYFEIQLKHKTYLLVIEEAFCEVFFFCMQEESY